MSFSKAIIGGVVFYALAVLTVWGLADEVYFEMLVWALLVFVWTVPVLAVVGVVVYLRHKTSRSDLILPNEHGDYPIIRQRVKVVDEATGKRVKREVYANPNLMPASFWFGKELSFGEMRQILLARVTSGNFGSLSKKMFDQIGGEDEPIQVAGPLEVPELQAPAQSLVIQSVARQLTD